MRTPYCIEAIEDHRQNEGVMPQGTYAHALLRTTYHIHAIEERRKKKGVDVTSK